MTDERDAYLEQFNALYRSEARGLHESATKRIRDAAKAEDIVHDVFQQAWLQREKIFARDARSQRRWLFSVLKNKCVDHVRRATRENAEREAQSRRQQPRGSTEWEPDLLLRDINEQCWKVIMAMPPGQRAVISLRAQEWRYSEIAVELGIAESTARNTGKKALEKLNNAIGPANEIFDDSADEGGDR